MEWIDGLGYFALAINLFSLASKGESRLRFFAIIANLMYILYGIFLGAWPIIIGCTVALFLHGCRLRQIRLKQPTND